jgi:hypothetical protein
MSYIYVRKNLTYMSNPSSQTLLKAFLKALYSDDYISICEEEYGFNRITGELRVKALAAIDDLIVSDGATEWKFENETEVSVGQGDFYISPKRSTYTQVANDAASSSVASLAAKLEELQASYDALRLELDELSGADSLGSDRDQSETSSAENFMNEELDEDSQVKVALGLGAASFTLWLLALIGFLVKFVMKV